MANDEYVLSQTADAFEGERLSFLERLLDPLSQRRLAGLGIGQDWRCLEVGAGHGSLARWLAAQVGPQGRVVATDINPRFLQLELPNVEVRQHDIRTEPLESDSYDLAHCRGLLMNLTEPEVAVRRMMAALRSGGWLMVEEGTLDDPHWLTYKRHYWARSAPPWMVYPAGAEVSPTDQFPDDD
jgi:ubiquinone/menaquinone biosynthesis C-methylase UbiE